MNSRSCVCEPKLRVAENLNSDTILLKRQKVFDKLQNLSDLSHSTSDWFVKLTLQKLLEKNAVSGPSDIFNNEVSDLFMPTGSPVQASTPYCNSNRKKPHQLKIFQEQDFSAKSLNNWPESPKFYITSFNTTEDELFTTPASNNRNSLGISLDETTYSWTNSLATPPGYNKTSSKDECKNDEPAAESKFFARALFSPNKTTTSELEESATLSTTVHTELYDNDQSITTAVDISEYSRKTSSPVLFEAFRNDDSATCLDTTIKAVVGVDMSSPSSVNTNKLNSSPLHSILIKNKQPTSLHKNVHFSDISHSTSQNKTNGKLASMNPASLLSEAEDRCAVRVSDDPILKSDNPSTGINLSSTETKMDLEENKLNQEIVDGCKISDLNYSFSSTISEHNSSRLPDDSLKDCIISDISCSVAQNVISNTDLTPIKSVLSGSADHYSIEEVSGDPAKDNVSQGIQEKPCHCLSNSNENKSEFYEKVKDPCKSSDLDQTFQSTACKQNLLTPDNSVRISDVPENIVNQNFVNNVEPDGMKVSVKNPQSKKNGSSIENNFDTVPDNLDNVSSYEKPNENLGAIKTFPEIKLIEDAAENKNVDTQSECKKRIDPQNVSIMFCNSKDTMKPKPTSPRSLSMKDRLKKKTKRFSYPTASQIHQSSPQVKFSFKIQSTSFNTTENGCSDFNKKPQSTPSPPTPLDSHPNMVHIKSDPVKPVVDNTADKDISIENHTLATNNTVANDKVPKTHCEEICTSEENGIKTKTSTEDYDFKSNSSVDSNIIQFKKTAESSVIQSSVCISSCDSVRADQPSEVHDACQINSNKDNSVVQTKILVNDCKRTPETIITHTTADRTRCCVSGISAKEGIQREHKDPNILQIKHLTSGSDSVDVEENLFKCNMTDKQQTTGEIIETTHNKIPPHNCLVQSSDTKYSWPKVPQPQKPLSSSFTSKKPIIKNPIVRFLKRTNTDSSKFEQFKDSRKSSIEDHLTASQIVYWQTSDDLSESFNDATLLSKQLTEGFDDEDSLKLSNDIHPSGKGKKEPAPIETVSEKIVNSDAAIREVPKAEERLHKIDCYGAGEKFQGFSTAKGQKIKINEKSLMTAQSLVNEAIEDFPGFSTNEQQKKQTNFKSKQNIQSLVAERNQRAGEFQGFSSAKRKKIHVNPQSLQNAQRLVNESDQDIEKFQGFSTGKGQKIQINPKSLQKAQNLLAEKEDEGLRKDQTLVNKSDQTIEGFRGFSTGKGQKILISTKNLQKAHSLLNECAQVIENLQGFSTAKGQKIKIHETSLQKAQNLLTDKDVRIENLLGFSTGKGENIKVNPKSLQKLQTDEDEPFTEGDGFKDVQSLVTGKQQIAEVFQGFSSAKGNKIKINLKSLQKAQSLIDESDPRIEGFQGFSTAKGDKIKINPNSLQKAQSLIDESDPVSFGNEHKTILQKSQSLENDNNDPNRVETLSEAHSFNKSSDKPLNKCPGFSTASGQKIKINENNLKKVQHFMTEDMDCLKSVLIPEQLSPSNSEDIEAIELFQDMQSIKKRKYEESCCLKRKLPLKSSPEKQLTKRFCPFKSPRVVNKSALLQNKDDISDKVTTTNVVSTLENDVKYLERITTAEGETKDTLLIHSKPELRDSQTREQNSKTMSKLQEINKFVTKSEDVDNNKDANASSIKEPSTLISVVKLSDKTQNVSSECVSDKQDESLFQTEKEIVSSAVTDSVTEDEVSSKKILTNPIPCHNSDVTDKDNQQEHIDCHADLKKKSLNETNLPLQRNLVKDLLFSELNTSETKTSDRVISDNDIMPGMVGQKTENSMKEGIPDQCLQLLEEFQKSFSEESLSDPVESSSSSKKRNYLEMSDSNNTSNSCKRPKSLPETSKLVSSYQDKEEDYESIISRSCDVSDDLLAQSMEIYENQPLRLVGDSVLSQSKLKSLDTNKQTLCIDDYVAVDNQMNDDISEELALSSAVERVEKELNSCKSNHTIKTTTEGNPNSKHKECEKSLNSRNTSEQFVLFQTALGKNVTVSEKSLRCARQMFTEADDVNKNKSTGQFVAFQTALGKDVTVSEKSIKCVQQIFSEDNDVDKNREPGQFVAFQTALGKDVTVSENSVRCAQQIFTKNNDTEKNRTPGQFAAFQTALGKDVTVSEKSLRCAQQMLNKDNKKNGNEISDRTVNQSNTSNDSTELPTVRNQFDSSRSGVCDLLRLEDQKLMLLSVRRESSLWKPSISHETEDRQKLLPLVTDPIQFHDFGLDRKNSSFENLLAPNIYHGTASSKKSIGNPSLNPKVSDFKTPYRKSDTSVPASSKKIPVKPTAISDKSVLESVKPIFKSHQSSVPASIPMENICSNPTRNIKSHPGDRNTAVISGKNSLLDIRYSQAPGDMPVTRDGHTSISSNSSYQESLPKTTHKVSQDKIQSDTSAGEFQSPRKCLVTKSLEKSDTPSTTKQLRSSFGQKTPGSICPENPESKMSATCLLKNKDETLSKKDPKIHWNVISNNINPTNRDQGNNSTKLGKSENKMSFELARLEQDAIILKKKQKNIQPNVGLLLSKKQSERQYDMAELLQGRPFNQYSHKQLFSLGVQPTVLKINSTNAQDYLFQLSDFYNVGYFDKFVIGDGALLVPDDSGCAGKQEFFRSFLTIECVDPKLITQSWFYNHYRWIIWKLAAYEVSLPTLFSGRCLSPEMVALQLKYRYDVEIDNCKRSALRKITERDDTPAKRMVLCVSNINRDKLKTIASSNIQNTEQYIEVTDGWYPLRMVLDGQTLSLVANMKIRVGQKLCICKAELVGSEEAFNPLEAYSQVQLKVNGNCCRPAKWNSRLGYQTDPWPFSIPLSHIHQHGGLVGSIDVVLTRIYPIMYMEKVSGSRAIFRSSHNEHKVEEEHKRLRQETLERVYNKVQQNFQLTEPGENNMKTKKFTRKEVSLLDNGQDIYNAVMSALHPESVQEYLSEHQRSLFSCYQQDMQSVRHQKIQEELQKALSDENEKKRNVVAVLKVRLVGCSNQDQRPLATTLLTIWKPTEDLISLLSEGSRYRIFNITPSQARLQFLKTTSVPLSASRSTHFERLKIDADLLSQIYSPRKMFTATSLLNSWTAENYPEVDIAGIVLNITKSLTANHHKLEQLHAVDVDGNIFTICFWGYMQVFSLDAVLQEGVIFAAVNLLKSRHGGSHSVTLDASTEISEFSLNPQSSHMRDCVKQLKDLKTKDSFLIEAYKKFELEKLASNHQGEKPKYHVKENVSSSSSSSSSPSSSSLEDSVKIQKIYQQHKMSKLLMYGTASNLPPLASRSSPSVHKAFKAPSLTKPKN